jgi:hypothetical protein
MRGIDSTVQVLGENSSSKTVERVVCLLDHIFLVFELDDNTDRTENLLLNVLHRWVSIGGDGGLDEATLGSMTLITMAVAQNIAQVVRKERPREVGFLNACARERNASIVVTGTSKGNRSMRMTQFM